MTSVSSLVSRAGKLAADNSPLILTALGVAGTLSTAILTGKASIRAYQIIDEVERVEGVHADPRVRLKERGKLVWKEFIPPVVSLAGTISCIICANRIGTRRAAAMAAAYAISQDTFTEYKTKVIEKIGEGKERAIRDDIARDRVMKNPPPTKLIVTDEMKVICYEQYTGRYFMSSMEDIKFAQNEINYTIINNNYASLSDLYDLIGLNRTSISEEVGWNLDNPLEITFSTVMSEDNRPCLSFNYKVVPIRNYFRLH